MSGHPFRRCQQDPSVAIVPAGMGNASMLGDHRLGVVLGHRQGIDICPQRDHRRQRAFSIDLGHETRAGEGKNSDPHRTQLLLDVAGGLVLHTRKFRVLVEVASVLDGSSVKTREFFPEICSCETPRTVGSGFIHAATHPLKGQMKMCATSTKIPPSTYQMSSSGQIQRTHFTHETPAAARAAMK